ncbi:MAG: hypothetical protein QF748_00515 [Candidatus Pacebacteria bacterium]|jgi:hypothetical protein|nr:hypothetical protein [Candidatus Paceibacterota bacterium]|tara:strand:- start:55 stop:276 length:222 start_codon:yes stop_codon:yes gene_type:complete
MKVHLVCGLNNLAGPAFADALQKEHPKDAVWLRPRAEWEKVAEGRPFTQEEQVNFGPYLILHAVFEVEVSETQ